MNEKHWKVYDVECAAGFRIIPEGSERAVAIAIQRDPNAHGLDGITADEALRHARLIAAAPTQHEEMMRYLPILERAEADPEIWEKLSAGTGIATANGYRAAIAKATGEA